VSNTEATGLTTSMLYTTGTPVTKAHVIQAGSALSPPLKYAPTHAAEEIALSVFDNVVFGAAVALETVQKALTMEGSVAEAGTESRYAAWMPLPALRPAAAAAMRAHGMFEQNSG
jgi:hypothetical protein